MNDNAAHERLKLELVDGSPSASLNAGVATPAEAIVAEGAYSYPSAMICWLVRIADGAAVLIPSFLAVRFVTGAVAASKTAPLEVAAAIGALIFLLCPKNQSLLRLPSVTETWRQVRYLAAPLLLAGLAELLVLWALGWRTRHGLAAALPLWESPVLALLLERSVGTFVLTRRPIQRRLARTVAVIGAGTQAFRIARRFEQDGSSSFRLCGVFDDGARMPGEDPVHGSIADLMTLSREHRLHSVIIALTPSDDQEQKVSRLVWRMRSILADVYIMPYLVHGPELMLPTESLGPLTLMVLQRRPLSEWQMLAKSAVDLLIGLIALLFLLPLLLMVSLAIRLESPGPVLFRQPRLGFNNCPFTVFKFRSMYTDLTDLTASQQTSRGDPRVTRVGKWLRRLSIDELPQLLNVIRGDMSLVGPRPHAPHTRAGGKLLDDALAEYVIRHQVKPGITGWAQVNGARGELVTTDDLRRRVNFDLEYMRRWSLWFDIKIMWLTVVREIVSRNAF